MKISQVFRRAARLISKLPNVCTAVDCAAGQEFSTARDYLNALYHYPSFNPGPEENNDINERNGYGVSQLWREIQAQGYVTQEINAHVPSLCGVGVVYR